MTRPKDYADASHRRLEKRRDELAETTLLSKREAEVLVYKQSGATHGEIAEYLDIEKGTVDSHAHRAAEKAQRAVETARAVRGVDELGTWDLKPLLESFIELAGPDRDDLFEVLDSIMYNLKRERFRTDGWPPDYDQRKELLVLDK